jgi:hypothetical protein
VLGDLETVVGLILLQCGSDGPSTMLRMVPLPIASQQGGQ